LVNGANEAARNIPAEEVVEKSDDDFPRILHSFVGVLKPNLGAKKHWNDVVKWS
jgi:hypothetical protein